MGVQQASIPLLDTRHVIMETIQLQCLFAHKRDFMLLRLAELGIEVHPPGGAFYLWCDLSALPAPLNNGINFLEECLKEKIIVVPGVFFEVNPGRRRSSKFARFTSFVRISYGPTFDELVRGCEGLKRVVMKFTNAPRKSLECD